MVVNGAAPAPDATGTGEEGLTMEHGDITTPTVLVLGAGASLPYNFPLGWLLRNEIIALLDTDRWKVGLEIYSDQQRTLREYFKPFGWEEDFVSQFREALRQADYDSIDRFMENRGEFAQIARVCIAFIISQREQYDSMYLDGYGRWMIEKDDDVQNSDEKLRGGHWYQYLFNCMDYGNDGTFADSHPKILTYNYDRSYEHALFTTFYERYVSRVGNTSELLERIKSVTVHHIHGQIGGECLPS